jgi:hypothetical protein
MNAHGWRGVHAFDAEAHGDGPVDFESCMTQEFQWSRSLTTILLKVTPKYWRRLPRRLRWQFLFAQLWYPCQGLTMLAAYLLPIVAILTRTPWVRVSYVEFLLHKIALMAASVMTVLWVKRNRWLKPVTSRIVTWETIVFQLTRWPWVLAGSVAAIVDALLQRRWDYRITPKGDDAEREISWRFLAPYLAIAGIAGLVAAGTNDAGQAAGYYYLVIVTGAAYSIVSLVLLLTGHRIKQVRGAPQPAAIKLELREARRPVAGLRTDSDL